MHASRGFRLTRRIGGVVLSSHKAAHIFLALHSASIGLDLLMHARFRLYEAHTRRDIGPAPNIEQP